MIELTRDDLAAIRNALGERYPIDERDQAIFRAGMAAMAERAAQACENRICGSSSRDNQIADAEARRCADAIRDKLLKP